MLNLAINDQPVAQTDFHLFKINTLNSNGAIYLVSNVSPGSNSKDKKTILLIGTHTYSISDTDISDHKYQQTSFSIAHEYYYIKLFRTRSHKIMEEEKEKLKQTHNLGENASGRQKQS